MDLTLRFVILGFCTDILDLPLFEQISRILVSLTSISQCWMLDNKFPFGEIATRIIKKWLPLMQECVQTLRWSSYFSELGYMVDGQGVYFQ